MKAVKCVFSGLIEEGNMVSSLTYGKIYEVIDFQKTKYTSGYSVLIVDDKGEQGLFFLEDTDGVWFVDAAPYIREDKLNQIGI